MWSSSVLKNQRFLACENVPFSRHEIKDFSTAKTCAKFGLDTVLVEKFIKKIK